MKKHVIFIMLLLLTLLLYGCGCEHTYSPASCEEPATCRLCGVTKEGSKKLGHTWRSATCERPKTCQRCETTMGESLGHRWNDATCTTPKTCRNCNATEGQPNGHLMRPATCTVPATCSVCQSTEGGPLEHQLSEATCTNAPTCVNCKKTVGRPLGHNYQDNFCTVCDDKMIETHKELESYLMKNFRTLTTAIGTQKYLNIEVVHNDPNYWHDQDFEIQIESTLWFEEVDCSLGYALVYADFLPYETRIQAVVDVLNYQKAIVEIAEKAFPGQKFEVKFYTWGYEYPNIQVGFNSETMMCWRNWESTSGGVPGYAGTYLTEWNIYTFDMLDVGTYDQQEQILADIRKAWPHDPIDNY